MARALIHIPVLGPKATAEYPHGLRKLTKPSSVKVDAANVTASSIDDRTVRVENADDKLVETTLRVKSSKASEDVPLQLQPGEVRDVPIALTYAIAHKRAEADKDGVKIKSAGAGTVEVMNTTDAPVRDITVTLES